MVFKTLCWIKFQPAQKFPCNQDLFQFRRPILCAFRRLSENTASDLYWPRIQTFHIKRVIIGSHQCGLLNSTSLHWLTMKTGFNQRYWNGDHRQPNSVKCARKIRNTLNKHVNKSEKRKHFCHLPKPEGIIKHCKCTFFLIEKPR